MKSPRIHIQPKSKSQSSLSHKQTIPNKYKPYQYCLQKDKYDYLRKERQLRKQRQQLHKFISQFTSGKNNRLRVEKEAKDPFELGINASHQDIIEQVSFRGQNNLKMEQPLLYQNNEFSFEFMVEMNKQKYTRKIHSLQEGKKIIQNIKQIIANSE